MLTDRSSISTTTTSREYFREAIKLSLPLVISQFLIMASGFISNLMLSRVSETVFAAGLFINVIQLILITVIFGLLSSLSPLIGKVIGQDKQLEHVGQLFVAGCLISLLLCIPTMVTLYFIEPIMLALGQPANLAHQCAQFFHIYLWSVPAAGLITVFIQLLLGTFKQIVVFFYSVGNLVISSLLGYALIFGKFGFPVLGLEGLAWAVFISSWSAALVLAFFILRNPDYQDKKMLNFQKQNLKKDARKIIKIGLPISIHVGNEMFSFLFMIVMVGWISIEALAMQQVVTRYLLMLAIPLFGLSQAITVVISKQFGANRISEIKHTCHVYMSMGVIYSIVILFMFAFIPNVFISVFIENSPENASIYQTLAIILVLVAIGQIFDAMKNILVGALRGLHDTRFPMQLSVFIVWPIGVPLAYVMGFTLNWGLIGITIAHVVVIAFGSLILYLRWINKFKNEESFYRLQETAAKN